MKTGVHPMGQIVTSVEYHTIWSAAVELPLISAKSSPVPEHPSQRILSSFLFEK
jgi:hypothetical protein